MRVYRKSFQILVVCGLFALPGAEKAFSEIAEHKLGFKLTGGWTYLVVGDLNAHNTDWNATRRRTVEAASGVVISENQELHWGGEISGDFFYYLSPGFALSVGTGYTFGKKADSAETRTGGITGLNTMDTNVSAVPIRAGGTWFIPVSKRARISLSAGLGFYFAKFDRYYRRESGDGYWINSDFTGKGEGVGFDGGVGFEYSISNKVAIVIEGYGRYARISGIEGTRARNDSNGWSDSIEGSYYGLEREREPNIWSRVFNIATEPPGGEGTRNVRDGVIDFSGFSLRIGLKLGLF